MSDAVFSHLPRFDVPNRQRVSDWLKPLGPTPVLPEDAAVHLPEESQPAGQVPLQVEPAPVSVMPAPAASDFTPMRKTVSELATTITRLEAEARQQTAATIQSVAAQLLPELSRHFLADEIARHLPGLVPVSVPMVEIRARSELAARLQELVDEQPALAGRCEVIPAEGQGRVEVSWKTGGVTFDFDELLKACLARLAPDNKTTAEQI